MEMNTRIQVEHPVTELVTGIDLVSWQIKIAAGEKLLLKQEDIKLKGHAIECRINAEDPDNHFKPSPGQIKKFHVPKNSSLGPVRLDTYVDRDYQIPAYYDSMMAKLIVHSKDRAEAIKLMQESLNEMAVEGVKTTLSLQKKILASKEFQKGNYSCGFLDEAVWQK